MKQLICMVPVAAFILGGCTHRAPSVTSRGPWIKPDLIRMTSEQAAQHGAALAEPQVVPAQAQGLDSTAVLRPAEVKVYSLGRYVDPADPELLHEAHLVYRREAGPAWVMQAGPAAQVLVGPRISASSSEVAPLREKELEGVLSALGRQVREDHEALEQITRLLETLNHKESRQPRPESARRD